ncbi:MAG: rod shape-determining protein RodA [Bacteroidetes bacterium]|nr:rod shape-determining protein RodA [Bacteroidota bacterium]
MRDKPTLLQNIDRPALFIYLGLLVIGSLTVFAVDYDKDSSHFFDLSLTHGRQMIWMFISLFVGFSLLAFDSNFFTKFSIPLYIFFIALLIITFIVAKEIKGARSWLAIGSMQFQPAEFAKTATALMLAKYISSLSTAVRTSRQKIIATGICVLPLLLIIAQQDMGSALVYLAFAIVLYREGFKVNEVVIAIMFGVCFLLSLLMDHSVILYILTGGLIMYLFGAVTKLARKFPGRTYISVFFIAVAIAVLFYTFFNPGILLFGAIAIIALLISGILILRNINYSGIWLPVFVYFFLAGFVAFGTDFIMTKALEPHQSQRVLTLVGLSDDPDANYDVIQSKMTIGSGGIAGKGYLQGTLTQLKHVPEQSTDFIFCTIGEEFGFLGTSIFLLAYLFFLLRIIHIAERQRSPFSRVYCYSVAAIFFFQIMINVGMTIGLVPVIGIPLPFISYGGSSVLAFSILVFIMLRLDADRLLILR